MVGSAQTIARLKSMLFLVEEALRIADEGESAMLGAKLSDCIDCLHIELAHAGGRPGIGIESRADSPLSVENVAVSS